MGSKSRIAKEIVPILQRYVDSCATGKYYEPFVGGANVIDKIHSKYKFGSDLNPYLIALLSHVQAGGSLYPEVSKTLYSQARTAVASGDTSAFKDWEIGNIGFLASYNGRWFDGGYAKPGYEKTQKGERYRDYYREASDNLIAQAKNLHGIEFCVCDYRAVQPHDSVVYCDPPYANTKKYANANSFDYKEFWETMRLWSKDNIVIVSELSAPSDWTCIWEHNVSRSIKANNKSLATEKLFMKG